MDGILNNAPLTETPSAPPPPPEVKVRTMRSDLESMAKSGGGLPRFLSVKVENLSFGKEPSATALPEKGKKKAVVVLIVIAAAAAIGVAGYFVYGMFFASGGSSLPSTPSSAQQGIPQPAPANTTPTNTGTNAGGGAGGAQAPAAPTPPVQTAPFTHASLFRKPADQVLTLVLSSGGTATSAADLQTFNQKLSALLGTASQSANVIEIKMQAAGGQGLAVSDLLAQANAPILSAKALAHFNPDATFFAYRAGGIFLPGLILSLSPGENWLFAKSDVAQLESSPYIANLFLQNVGAPSADGFTDAMVSSTAVRVLPFLDAVPPEYFTYGWYQNDLILSTSQAAFLAAAARL